MAHPSTLYRFRIDLTDIDRGVYQKLDFRIALHPSESPDFLITRVLAFALNAQEDLKFSKEGLGNPEDPCISVADPSGGYKLCIEIGNGSAKKIHKVSKTSQQVKIYTYKNPELLAQELRAAHIYNLEKIKIYSFSESFLEPIYDSLVKDNSWNLIHHDHLITLQVGEETHSCEMIAMDVT